MSEENKREDIGQEFSDFASSVKDRALFANDIVNMSKNHNAKTSANKADTQKSSPKIERNNVPANAGAIDTIADAGTGLMETGAGETAVGTVAASTEAGAAGGVPGVVIGAIIGAAKAVKNASDVSVDSEDQKAPKVNMLVFFVLGFMFLTVFCGTMVTKGMASLFSQGQETEYMVTKYNSNNMSDADTQYKMEASSPLNKFNDDYPISNAIMDYVWGTEGHKGFRNTCMEAIRENLTITVQSLEKTIPSKKWDGHRTMSHFYNLPWPYDLQRNSYEIFPSIGDVLHPDPGGEYEIDNYSGEYLAKFDDVNWSEVITILSQNIKEDGSHAYSFNWGENNYEDFMKFIETDRCKDYMYELGVKWIPIYTGKKVIKNEDGSYTEFDVRQEGSEYEDPSSCLAAPPVIEYEGTQLAFTDFWTKTEVRPFGLRELYEIAQVKPEDKHDSFYQHTNYELLDHTERITRTYQRDKRVSFKSGGGADQLGPSAFEKRSDLSTIIEFLKNDATLIEEGKAGQGRSCWFYIEKVYDRNLAQLNYSVEVPQYEKATPPPSVQLSGSLKDKLAYFFPDGLPTEAEMGKYLTTVRVLVHRPNGSTEEVGLTVHKMVAESVKAAMQDLYDIGFIVSQVGSYNWRGMNGAPEKQSMHSYGLAIDLNQDNNPFIKNGVVRYGTTWNPGTDPLAIDQNIANVLIKHGWLWGGNWRSSKDYMHFSVTGY